MKCMWYQSHHKNIHYIMGQYLCILDKFHNGGMWDYSLHTCHNKSYQNITDNGWLMMSTSHIVMLLSLHTSNRILNNKVGTLNHIHSKCRITNSVVLYLSILYNFGLYLKPCLNNNQHCINCRKSSMYSSSINSQVNDKCS